MTRWQSFFVMILFMSCGKEDVEPDKCLAVDESQLTIEQQVLLEVVFGSEFEAVSERARKWNQDLKIFVPESPPDFLDDELDLVIAEINGLSQSTRINRVYNEAISNLIMYFGDGETYIQEYEPAAKELILTNRGLFSTKWDRKSYEIYSGTIWVDLVNEQDPDCLKHLLREELTQVLGMVNDIDEFEDSIFYEGYRCGTEYTALDRELIMTFLKDEVKAGMCKADFLKRMN